MSFLRNLLWRIRDRLRRFMVGRYGSDKLNMAILGIGLLLIVVTMINPIGILDLILTGLSYAMMFWAIFRTFSRNTYKRREENRYYLRCRDTVKRKLQQYRLRWAQRKEYRFFRCEKCRTLARVPRGRGKICITCPHCKHEFIRKS